MTSMSKVVFLVDVDNTLLDNDKAQDEYLQHIKLHLGEHAAERYWSIFEQLTKELGYADYLGALQRYRLEDFHDPHLLLMSSFLLDYPFSDRLYPYSLDVLKWLRSFGPTVIFSDGDVVFQPRKVERSGIRDAVDGRVLIYIHKEEQLSEVERLYPADHYVLIDDKRRILAAIKKIWGARVTTIQPLQGHYASDPNVQAAHQAADITLAHIGDLLNYDISPIIEAGRP
jgi:phosphoserine phosphatase